jgi:hypothetical protein
VALTHRRNPGPAGRLALGVLGGALIVLGTGCASAPSRSALTAEVSTAQQQTVQPVPAIARALGQHQLAVSVALSGSFSGCRSSRTQVSYDAEITMTPRTRTSISQLNRTLVNVMRAAGWRLQAVDVSRGPVPTVPHPAYTLNRASLHGAVNILPARSGGAEALAFISSPCFDAGDSATKLERGPAS